MPDRPDTAITTLLFTDLVNSTELIQQLGDERAQQVFEAHHQTLTDLLAAHGGEELQWEGDGLMAAFPSSAEAVRCTVAMQRALLQPVLGQRIEMRAGLNVGEILRQEIGSGHFGTPVVVASRLCDRAVAGQILASNVVAALLAGRQAFRFRDLGQLELKGIELPVGVCEVLYEAERPSPLAGKTPFVGRSEELGRLRDAAERAAAGSGGLVLAVGEPGIGKTRTLEEFAAWARTQGAQVLWGRCYEGEGTRPYTPFAEALEDYIRRADPEELGPELGPFGAAIDAVAPSLRVQLPELAELPRLEPEEESARLFEAVTQLLLAAARRAPLLLVLDDLHWADRGTIALLRHVARFAGRGRLLLLGAYRDVELDRLHPLADALAVLKREAEYERIALKGLDADQVGELLQAMAAHEVPAPFVETMSAETEGNPFFIREILLHLLEEGKLYLAEGRWTSDLSVDELGIPEGVRQVIGRRLSRLSKDANGLLRSAAGFDGSFPFEVASGVAGLDDVAALDALDEALEAQLVRPRGGASSYEFTHALIRHTLYGELNPSRQVRLHRRIAEEMERYYGESPGEHSEETAKQYYRSAALPGADRGVAHCLAAADRAHRAAAHEETARSLRMALDLLPEGDPRRPRVLARLGLALAWCSEEAVDCAYQAGELIAESEGGDAAADYLADVTEAVWSAESSRDTWRLAALGLRHIGERRDLTWARLAMIDMAYREESDSEHVGIPLASPERMEASRVVLDNAHLIPPDYTGTLWDGVIFSSAEEVRKHATLRVVASKGGRYREALGFCQAIADTAVKRGQFARAAVSLVMSARLQAALGDLDASTRTMARASELGERAGNPAVVSLNLTQVPAEHAILRDEGVEALLPVGEALLERPRTLWAMAVIRALMGVGYALVGRGDDAARMLEATLPAIDRAPGGVTNYTQLPHCATAALWTLERPQHMELLERNVREKVLAPDFRHPHTDARLSLARLCALQGRFEEAEDWFAKARVVLDEEYARPLRALADYDEALMYARRGASGDRERTRALVDLALPAFREIGMPGWIRRAEALVVGGRGLEPPTNAL